MLEDPIGLPVLPVVDLGLEQLLGHALLHLPIHRFLCVFVRAWGRKKEIRARHARGKQARESNVWGLRMATRANGHRHMHPRVLPSKQRRTVGCLPVWWVGGGKPKQEKE